VDLTHCDIDDADKGRAGRSLDCIDHGRHELLRDHALDLEPLEAVDRVRLMAVALNAATSTRDDANF